MREKEERNGTQEGNIMFVFFSLGPKEVSGVLHT